MALVKPTAPDDQVIGRREVPNKLQSIYGNATDELLAHLIEDGRVIHVQNLPARAECFGELTLPLRLDVAKQLGIQQFWNHQAEAIDLARAGENIVIATSTASGKSLCYQAAIADAVADPNHIATALAFFPTKALAQDQLRSLSNMKLPMMVPTTYDGDSSQEHRAWARTNANVILTNPEMVHSGMLPNHRRWAPFLRRLRYVVIDELHVFRGVFGTHMSHVLRRLLRLCEFYGAAPTFIFTSATIGDPARLASDLCSQPVSAISDDGSPSGSRKFALLNPPIVDIDTGARTSTNAETSSVLASLLKSDHRVIAFCGSRKGTELIARDLRRSVTGLPDEAVRSYRGGYLPYERRQIEDDLASGKVRAVIATSALELGVDIGDLDACVLNGFPGTIASMWQQAGRAGRRQQNSLAVLVAGTDQLDQWLMAHPTELFTRPPERAVINPSNPHIIDPHLACAAHELPLAFDDYRWWGDNLDEAVGRLAASKKVRIRQTPEGPLAVWDGRGWPSRGVGLRSGSSAEYSIRLRDGTLVGTVDEARAFDSVHPGAIYLHRGDTYRVIDLDTSRHIATVEETDNTEYTQPRSAVDIEISTIDDTRSVGQATLHLGSLEVTTTMTGYQRRLVRSRKIVANVPLDLPPQRLVTRGFWYTIDYDIIDDAAITDETLPGTLHAIEHAAIAMMPLFAICDRWDVGGVSTALQADTQLPSIFIYDGYSGGAGIAELGFEAADRHLQATLELLQACGCAIGCPSCVQSPKCGNGNDPLDKVGAIALLTEILR